MKKIVFVSILLALPLAADITQSETYSWIDVSGNVQFTDDLTKIPIRYRSRLMVSEDITLANPEVREAVAERRKVAAEFERQEQETRRLREQERLATIQREQAERSADRAQTPAKRAVTRHKKAVAYEYKTRPT